MPSQFAFPVPPVSSPCAAGRLPCQARVDAGGGRAWGAARPGSGGGERATAPVRPALILMPAGL